MKHVQMIPVSQIRVLNHRARNKAKFREIVGNISIVGLKKPITVSRRESGEEGYDLVCGEGRLEACIGLGQAEVPAIVIDVPKQDRYLMSLVENLARRAPPTLETLKAITDLADRGYAQTEIAAKVGLSEGYVSTLLRLMRNGEERLVKAVTRGDISIAVAAIIAGADDKGVQRCLTEAYESGQLRGGALHRARRLIEMRRTQGKSGGRRGPRAKRPASKDELVRAYKREADKQRLLVKNARLCERQILFVSTALQDLLRDENFVNLLRAESLDTAPRFLVKQESRA